MEIPLWIILIPLAVIIAITGLFLVFNVFHLARYGISNRGAMPLMIIYLVSYGCVLMVGLSLLKDIPWNRPLSVNDILPFTISNPSALDL